MGDLSLEERTIGFLLRVPYYAGATEGVITSPEITPFLDKPEDFEVLRDCSSGIDPFPDALRRNPFLDGSHYRIGKDLVNLAVQNGYSLEEALVQLAAHPFQSNGANEDAHDNYRDVSALLQIYQFCRLIAHEIGADEPVKEQMLHYIKEYSLSVREVQGNKIKDASPPDPSKLSMDRGGGEEPTRLIRLGQYKRNIKSLLLLPQIVEDIELCRNPNRDSEHTGIRFRTTAPRRGDKHLIGTLANLTSENLEKYHERYRFNDARYETRKAQ
jgi:hypothetical protein